MITHRIFGAQIPGCRKKHIFRSRVAKLNLQSSKQAYLVYSLSEIIALARENPDSDVARKNQFGRFVVSRLSIWAVPSTPD